MVVSRRLRFEVLRRDNHTCRYCGMAAPDVPLTVDHVIPMTLGGGDDPSNLVTACQPCNAGKSSLAPDSEIVADVQDDALRWKQAMEVAVELQRLDRELIEGGLARFEETWDQWTYGSDKNPVPRSDDYATTVERFLKLGLPVEEILRFVRVAMSNNKVKPWETWRYFCGCCWRALSDLQEEARRILETQEAQRGAD